MLARKVATATSRKIHHTMIVSKPATMDEFLAQLEESRERLEFYGGEILAMSGGTLVHSTLTARVATLLANVVRPPCRVFDSQAAVRIDDTAFVYPDVSVSCETFGPTSTELRAPLLVVEVLSSSTASRDRTEKLDYYQSLDSLQDCVLVDGRRKWVCVFHRMGDRWSVTVTTADDAIVTLESVGLTTTLGALYHDLPLGSE